MVNAIVLLEVDRDKINAIADTLTAIEGVSEVYSVAGRYDLAVIIRTKDNEGLATVVTDKMLKIPGIRKSETMISFRVYSKLDLERMFSL
jgi:DNA-binding Lrp family transcriptional regulator